MIDVDALCSTINDVRRNISEPDHAKGMSEADTRANFIDPLLAALGWNIQSIRREWPVKDTGQFIDYVLFVGGDKAVAVEAKPLGRTLSSKDAAQVVQYSSIEGIRWCVLTNGRNYEVYDQHITRNLQEKLIFKLDLSQGPVDDELVQEISLLSVDSLRNGDLE